jgi:hypothetical protein
VADVQFAAATGKLFIDRITDPSGTPLDVFDADQGVTFDGHLELPGWLSGDGVITLYADEVGGPEDKAVHTLNVPIDGGPKPDPTIYPWTFTVNPIPLPEDRMYKFGLVFVLKSKVGGHTEIGAFFDLGVYLVV